MPDVMFGVSDLGPIFFGRLARRLISLNNMKLRTFCKYKKTTRTYVHYLEYMRQDKILLLYIDVPDSLTIK